MCKNETLNQCTLYTTVHYFYTRACVCYYTYIQWFYVETYQIPTLGCHLRECLGTRTLVWIYNRSSPHHFHLHYHLKSLRSIRTFQSVLATSISCLCPAGSFPGKSIKKVNCMVCHGVYTETLNVELCTYKSLFFSNCKLRHGWPMYKFQEINQLAHESYESSHWPFDSTLNSSSTYSKNANFVKQNCECVDFLVAGHKCVRLPQSIVLWVFYTLWCEYYLE